MHEADREGALLVLYRFRELASWMSSPVRGARRSARSRAIAEMVGVSQTQVANDLRAGVNDGFTVGPPVTVVGRDGRRYAGRPKRAAAGRERGNTRAQGGDEAA